MSLVVHQPGFGLAATLEAHRRALARVAENSARDATVALDFTATGNGQSLGKPFPFGVTFLEMPTMTFGVSLAEGQVLGEIYPAATCGVATWVADDRGLFIGAQLFFRVDTGGGNPEQILAAKARATERRLEQVNALASSNNADVANYALTRATAEYTRAREDVLRLAGVNYDMIFMVNFMGVALKLDPTV